MHHVLRGFELHDHLHVMDKENTMECKVRIGIAYEPKWFERRQTNGWYSAKNPPLDTDAMWLQNALIARQGPRIGARITMISVAWIAGAGAYFSFFL